MKIFLIFATVFLAVTEGEIEGNPTYHREFDRNELVEIFGVNHFDNVPKYIPAVVKGDTKLKGSTTSRLTLKADGMKELTIKVSLNDKTIPESHTIEFVAADGRIESQYQGKIGEYSKGHIENDENSHVALHHNGKGISGLIRTTEDMYIIQPLPRRMANDQANHVMYRMLDLPSDHIIKKYTYTEEDVPLTEAAKKSRSRPRRAVPHVRKKKTMELMLAADYTMLEWYGADILPTYLINTGNILAGIFHDTSLQYPLDIALTRTVIFKDNIWKPKTVQMQLRKFSWWVQTHNFGMNDTNPRHVDAAILLSRGGCKDGCEYEGLAKTALCHPQSQGVVKDRGFGSVLHIAHELAHTIMAKHDGHANRKDCLNGYFIMASGSQAPGRKAFKWSKCTSETFAKYLKSSASSCFNDVPLKSFTDSHFLLYGQVYNQTTQCEYMWGGQYYICEPFMHDCGYLHCRRKKTNTCVKISLPAMHGSYCAPHKWCMYGECVPDGTKAVVHKAEDGQWGSWTDYTACSRTCGVGIRFKIRHCNKPAPKHGGKWCNPRDLHRKHQEGFYETCNTQECVGVKGIDRDRQCVKRSKGTRRKSCSTCGADCELVCGDNIYEGGVLGHADLGTLCRTHNVAYGACVYGMCVDIGCDKKLRSGVEIDRCSKCGGNGTTCEKVKGINNRTNLHWGIYGNPVTTIPAYSRDIIVKEGSVTMNFLGYSFAETGPLEIILPTMSVEKHYPHGKVIYLCRWFPYDDKLIVRGTLDKDMYIWNVNLYYDTEKYIEWSYTKDLHTPGVLGNTKWAALKWTGCSKKCAGGWKRRHVFCKREDDNTPCHPHSCDKATKPSTLEKCNLDDCPAIWLISPWKKCSKKCATGKTTRTIDCKAFTHLKEFKIVDDSVCKEAKPTKATSKACNAIMCHARYDTLQRFSPCSVSCGGGKYRRTVRCKRVNKDGQDEVTDMLDCANVKDKPMETATCNADVPCPDWKINYSPCSGTCGNGKMTAKNISCQSITETYKHKHCKQATKPKLVGQKKKACKHEMLCAQHQWKKLKGSCSATCGKATRSIAAKCFVTKTNKPTADSNCSPEPKPKTTVEKCEPIIMCQPKFIWKTKKVGICDKRCGGGKQRSVAYCVKVMNGKHKVVDTRDCDVAKKPKPKAENCNMKACLYKWVSEFDDCSVTCGGGVQKTTSTCIRISTKKKVADSFCKFFTKTEKTQACNRNDCPPESTFAWENVELGCNIECGKGQKTVETKCKRTTRTVRVTVTATVKSTVESSECEGKTKPPVVVVPCQKDPCPKKYEWNVTYGDCNAHCGRGYNIKVMQCFDKTTDAEELVTDISKCPAKDIPKDKPCKANPCPTKFSGGKYYSVGCYWDRVNRRTLPYQGKNLRYNITDWTNLNNIIKGCYRDTIKRDGHTFFSVQYYGECWSGTEKDAGNNYNHFGVAANCYIGVGGTLSNYVYHIGEPLDEKPFSAIEQKGCYTDDSKQNKKVKASNAAEIKWDKGKFDAMLKVCVLHAKHKNWQTFGLEVNAGKCLDEHESKENMKKPKFQKECIQALEAVEQYFIYKFMKKL